MDINKLLAEFLNTPEEVHYLVGGFLSGVLVGMWLGFIYTLIVLNTIT